MVPRAKTVKVSGLNENGDDVELVAKDWTARIIQHEMDHLSGIMITDKMDPGSLSMDYWSYVNSRQGDFKLSFHGIKSGPRKWFASPLLWLKRDQ
ncbi:peptide deformylase, mitochondrial-like [Eurytemora carolleeae]|uniref:peptide deformylase, mitochondrial-like n=1 Tax=Eurytemora carolleeae TaxID=1294199 RepID=UPI000C766D2E|nr:peptide deformylase, mitochondrial-like [Eurytemora carolleeae]|eukprot:XP_023341281.1 peptide deformylase, mitochondrial-like [Eurytemora affinis]